MILRVISILFLIGNFQSGCAQGIPPTNRPELNNPDFDRTITRLLNFTVPVLGVEELGNIQDEVFIFDTRDQQEYEVSHIPGAKFLGYSDFDLDRINNLPKDSKIVLYCSVGYRSEKIGEKLRKEGYNNVFNLYGGIFEWINEKKAVIDNTGKESFEVHTYNKQWSKWVENNEITKEW